MKIEACKGAEIESITLHRDKKTRTLVVHLVDGRHIDLGWAGLTFGQAHFRNVMAEHGLTMTKLPLMQWDNFCISLMQKAKHGGV